MQVGTIVKIKKSFGELVDYVLDNGYIFTSHTPFNVGDIVEVRPHMFGGVTITVK